LESNFLKKEFESYEDYRNELGKLIRLEMLGPNKSDSEEDKNRQIRISPDQQFSCGILFPVETTLADTNTQSEMHDEFLSEIESDDIKIENKNMETNSKNFHEDDDPEPSLDLSNQHSPSSIAITFKRNKKNPILVEINFSKYFPSLTEDENKYPVYIRKQYEYSFEELKPRLQILEPSGNLFLRSKIRDIGDNYEIITLSIVNLNQKSTSKDKLVRYFFQPEIIVFCDNGFEPLEPEKEAYKDAELASDALLYRNKKVFCRGHGCAGDWDDQKENNCYKVFSNSFPEYEVRPIEPKGNIDGVDFSFDANSLWGQSEKIAQELIFSNLSNIIDDYSLWIKSLKLIGLDDFAQETATSHIEKCQNALSRMRDGLEILKNNNTCFKAFRIANRAMLMQQHHGAIIECQNTQNNIPYADVSFLSGTIKRGWRPFQLAFFLMNLNCIKTIEGYNAEMADVVDLIWFPTGGGKTEAYLGVAAYAVALSKLKNPRSNSTEVIMRYTLRLLSAQQFERAATLMMAMELMRKKGELGEECKDYGEPIRAGLWVGSSLTPNKVKNAKKSLRDLHNDDTAPNPFQILSCPWCKSDLRNDNFAGYKFNRRKNNIDFICRNTECDYGDQILPISVIDENLYEYPPTLLLGTVDKFAQLSWLQEPKNFLGHKTGSPPSLIIQDELHLISGPLGSIVGHYEVLLQKICKHYGSVPKIIASTATIKRAEQQVRSLYNREVAAFPPQGLTYDDSYFAQESKDHNKPGRRYIGVFGSATNSMITAQKNLLAPLLQFPSASFGNFIEEEKSNNDGEIRLKLKENCENPFVDPYGTIIWYFNSLRELGYADTLLVSDISEYLKNLCRRYNIEPQLRRFNLQVTELTSRAKDSAISEILKLLEEKWTPKPWDEKKCLDVLLATNMISVGVDINRLGLMVITGQPKSTSEYIQASSRVGRSHPGLVFTLYNQSRSRDRSHFEMFKTYHQALYRSVEPSSVTPFSYKARERALPGLIIGMARNIFAIENPNDFNKEISLKILDELEDYLELVYYNTKSSDEVESAEIQINKILDTWLMRNAGATITWGSMGGIASQDDLVISTGQNTSDFSDKIEVMTSMRNVDLASRATIIKSMLDLD
jgi:hypothetical protein